MAQGNAVERYEAFEKLKNQFDNKSAENFGANSQRGEDINVIITKLPSSSSKDNIKAIKKGVISDNSKAEGRNFNEEGDLMQKSVAAVEYVSKTLVKGQWKNNDNFKFSHLNCQDLDTIETASVASCSSAYSSRSESSFMSPPIGSCTELSDAGSCDTHQEYDIYPRKTRNMSKFWSSTAVADVEGALEDQVKTSARIWNKLISDWTFEGVVDVTATPTSHPKYVATNETPMRSTESGLDSDSSSLCSDSSYMSAGPPIAPGKSAWGKRMSASNLADLYEPSSSRSGNAATLKPGCHAGILELAAGTVEEQEEQGVGTQKITLKKLDQDPKSEDTAKETEIKATTHNESKSEQNPIKEKEKEEAESARCNRPKIRSVSERIKQLTRSQSESDIKTSAPASAFRPSKFGEAYRMYRDLQTLSESGSHNQGKRKLVSVKERAQLFGQK